MNAEPLVAFGKMPAAIKAAELPFTKGSVLALKGWKIGWFVAINGFALLALLESALQDSAPVVGLTRGVLKACPALVKKAC